MPSYEQIRLIGGPCDGDVHMWDGGDYFEVKRHLYRRERSGDGWATDRFIYQGEN